MRLPIRNNPWECYVEGAAAGVLYTEEHDRDFIRDYNIYARAYTLQMVFPGHGWSRNTLLRRRSERSAP